MIADEHRGDGKRFVVRAFISRAHFTENRSPFTPFHISFHVILLSQRVWELNPRTSLESAYVSPRVRFAVATLLLLFGSSPSRIGKYGRVFFHKRRPRESVAFSFKVSNLPLKCFALLFSVL